MRSRNIGLKEDRRGEEEKGGRRVENWRGY
jgi:hypothetical protein